jgi:hypothetical protein
MFRKLLPLFFLLIAVSLHAQQDVNAHSPQPAKSSHQQAVADKKKVERQKQNDKAVEKGKKRHMKLQAKNTKKMMKESKRKSTRRNENKREPFLRRLFTKSHH